MSRRIIDTMIVEMGAVIPDDVFIISASTTPNGRIALIVERDEVLEEALGDEVWTDEDVEAERDAEAEWAEMDEDFEEDLDETSEGE